MTQPSSASETWQYLVDLITEGEEERFLELLPTMKENVFNLQDSENGNNIVHTACFYNRLKSLQSMQKIPGFEKAASTFNSSEKTPFIIAVRRASNEVCFLLLKVERIKETLPIISDNGGHCVIQAACTRETPVILNALLSIKDVDLRHQLSYINNIGRHCIHIAARWSDAMLKVLLELPESRCLLNLPTMIGRTALHIVCRQGLLNRVKILMNEPDIQVSVNMSTIDGNTPLLEAVFSRNVELIRFILQFPMVAATCLRKDIEGNTPLHQACKSGPEEVVEIILAKEEGMQSLNCQNAIGKTPIHFAIDMCSVEMVRRLVQTSKLNVTCKDNWHQTPMHCVCKLMDEDVANSIIDLLFHCKDIGSSLSVRDKDGHTPFDIASKNGRFEQTYRLLADPRYIFIQDFLPGLQEFADFYPERYLLLKLKLNIPKASTPSECIEEIQNRWSVGPKHAMMLTSPSKKNEKTAGKRKKTLSEPEKIRKFSIHDAA